MKKAKGEKAKGVKDEEVKDEEVPILAVLRNDDGDQAGEVILTFDEKDVTEFEIGYEMDVDPNCGSDCYFAIYDGISCDNRGDQYFCTEENPWNDQDSSFSASANGIASGTKAMDAGKYYGDIHCTVMVVYGPPSNSGNGPDVMMCGVLKKDGFDGSCESTQKSKSTKKCKKSRRNRN